MYPPTRFLRAARGALLCGSLIGGWAQAAHAQVAVKADKGRKVGERKPGGVATAQGTFTFSNSAPITINDATTGPAAATPYPSNVTVGASLNPTGVRVRVNNLSHTTPGDIDVLLVGPGGQKFTLMSDAGNITDIADQTLTFDDAATATLPFSGGFSTGTFKPTDWDSQNPPTNQLFEDLAFPGPAPAAPYDEPGPAGAATLNGTFGTTGANGTWSLYVVDDNSASTGQIAGGWDLILDFAADAPAVGDPVISEMRFEGPGPGGSLELFDDFVELQNVSAKTLDLSGLKLRMDNGTGSLVDVIINNGTFLLPGQHFLAASPSFTLGGVAAPDQSYTADISRGVQITLADNTVLDQVGRSTSTLVGEGTRLSSVSGIFRQNSYVRRLTSGKPQDTDDNAADFIHVSTTGDLTGGEQVLLGSPGPENRGSPVQRNQIIKAALIDPGCAGIGMGADNDEFNGTCANNRNSTPDPATNADQGTFAIRRNFRNNTSQTLTALRFRVVDITTRSSPGAGASQADLRARTSISYSALCNSGGAGCPVPGQSTTIRGTTLDAPAGANNGGLNSTLTVALPGGALAPGASVNVQFVFGVKQTGSFRFFVNVEALP